MFRLNILAAACGVVLSKRYGSKDGTVELSLPYPMVLNFNSYKEEISSIEDFHAAVLNHAGKGHCLLKGLLEQPLTNEPRAGQTQSHETTRWMVLDNDYLHDLEPQAFMELIGLGDVDYIVQYSASAGIIDGKMGYHILFLLDKPYHPADLKLYLKHLNLSIPTICDHLSLTRTNMSLRWPIDITVCQNDKLIYIAPPVCGPGVTDTLKGKRIELVKGSQRTATLKTDVLNEDQIRTQENDVINSLRLKKNLPHKQLATRVVHGEEVLKNPEKARITGRKEERDFVYINLNDGDSWGYFHPIDNPRVLYNFKDEPNYLIRELAPDYYRTAMDRAKRFKKEEKSRKKQRYIEEQHKQFDESLQAGSRIYTVFRDRVTDQYFGGFYDHGTQHCVFNPISSKDKAADFLVQNGATAPELIETLNYQFQPDNRAIFDPDNLFINKFEPSEFMKNAQIIEGADIPTTIKRVISHALGNDPILIEHFLNWLAVIFQHRTRTQTAWVLQGTTGTGKGLLFQKIIRPLIGEQYCRSVTLPNLEDQFNGFMDQTLILFIDEVDTDQVRDMPKLTARLKNMITEPTIPLRSMRTDLREVPNYLNVITASNQPNSMRIEENDRRYNICSRQERMLLNKSEKGEALVARLRKELPAFSNYLASRSADISQARTALENVPKQELQRITQTAIEEVCEALRNGDLAYFVTHMPEPVDPTHMVIEFENDNFSVAGGYHRVVQEAITACQSGEKHLLTHIDLIFLVGLLVSKCPLTKVKLTKFLGHHRIPIRPHTVGGTSNRGFKVKWHATKSELAQWEQLLTGKHLRLVK